VLEDTKGVIRTRYLKGRQ